MQVAAAIYWWTTCDVVVEADAGIGTVRTGCS
jgi:hypothetical protein